MKGLLYKEWATLTNSYKQTVFFIAFLYGGISILTGQTGMAYALLVVFSILITSTISFDENSHWDIYARTLPVTPAQPQQDFAPHKTRGASGQSDGVDVPTRDRL